MSAELSPEDLDLLDRWQRDFPLDSRPYATIGQAHGLGEAEVLARLAGLQARGLVSRVGAAVSPARLAPVAARVSAEPGVNHNYEREHRLNLWFVATGPDRAGVAATLGAIACDTGIGVLDLPLERAYHIDLGFPLAGESSARRRRSTPVAPAAPLEVAAEDRALLAALEDGLPLIAQPYAALARRLGWGEAGVRARLRGLRDAGVIARFGVIVRHRALGYRANAMAVWDVADERVDGAAAAIAAQRFVTLCYRRPRRLPDWPYNLFCMVHGRDRDTVRAQLGQLNAVAGTAALPQAVLFSRRCFKQRGARFTAPPREAVA